MSLILSKILPLFVYPLGLAAILLGFALVRLSRRRPKSLQSDKTAIVLVSIALAILLLSSNKSVSDLLVRSLEWQNIPPSVLPNAEAIVVLGGGTRAKISPRPWIEVTEAGDRILYGAQLFLQGKAPLLIVSGGRAEWYKEGGNPESEDMLQIAQVMGVPARAIIQDPTSLNTRENALNVQQILKQQNIHSILLVTSAMHMPRSLAIFRKLGINAIAAPTDFLTVRNTNDPSWAGLIVDLLPDSEMLERTTRVLKEYIGLAIYTLRGWA